MADGTTIIRGGTVYDGRGGPGYEADVVVRDGVVVYEGRIVSLRRFKDDVPSVAAGFECGIGLEGFRDIKEGDTIESFEVREIARV